MTVSSRSRPDTGRCRECLGAKRRPNPSASARLRPTCWAGTCILSHPEAIVPQPLDGAGGDGQPDRLGLIQESSANPGKPRPIPRPVSSLVYFLSLQLPPPGLRVTLSRVITLRDHKTTRRRDYGTTRQRTTRRRDHRTTGLRGGNQAGSRPSGPGCSHSQLSQQRETFSNWLAPRAGSFPLTSVSHGGLPNPGLFDQFRQKKVIDPCKSVFPFFDFPFVGTITRFCEKNRLHPLLPRSRLRA